MSQQAKNAQYVSTAYSEDWLDLRLVSAMRLMLAASALWILYLDPAKTQSHPQLTYFILTLYTLYSAGFYLLSLRWATLLPAAVMPWIDVAWCLALVALTHSSGLFFTFLFFPILVASFGWGYSAGLYVTLVSAIILTLIGFSGFQDSSLDATQFMLRPIQLQILGYLIARWGGFRVNLRNRLRLLKELTVLSNPRFGIDRTVNSILESLRAFYDAEACLLLMRGNPGNSYVLFRAKRNGPPTGSSEISTAAASLFLSTPNQAVIYCKSSKQCSRFDIGSRQLSSVAVATFDPVVAALETTTFLSVPLGIRENDGRLYLVGSSRKFDKAEIDFVLQLTDHLMPLVENIRLVDNLASEAAEEERRRIGHDIHDSVIQPYLGLQLGITAVARKVQTGDGNVLTNLEELLELTNQELVELRRYVRELRDGGERADALIPAINRFVERFASVTGIKVEVQTRGKLEVSDRLAAELFQIVAEGLSNVRRHAFCNDAKVEIGCNQGTVMLQIKNPRSGMTGSLGFAARDHAPAQGLFTPHSIADRAAMLGGETKVAIDNGFTVVSVMIPI